MAITPNPLTGVITAAAFNAELDRARTWVNDGVLAADVVAETLNETHIYRPDVYGFPKQSADGQLQVQAENRTGQHAPPFFFDSADGSISGTPARSRERFSIFLNALDLNERFEIAQTFRRVVLDSISDVDVGFSMEITTRTNDTVATVATTHPATAGRLEMVYRNVDAGTSTLITDTSRRINVKHIAATVAGPGTSPEEVGGLCYHARSSLQDLPPGTYDFWVRYVRNGASLDIEQVIIGTSNVVIEIHK